MAFKRYSSSSSWLIVSTNFPIDNSISSPVTLSSQSLNARRIDPARCSVSSLHLKSLSLRSTSQFSTPILSQSKSVLCAHELVYPEDADTVRPSFGPSSSGLSWLFMLYKEKERVCKAVEIRAHWKSEQSQGQCKATRNEEWVRQNSLHKNNQNIYMKTQHVKQHTSRDAVNFVISLADTEPSSETIVGSSM